METRPPDPVEQAPSTAERRIKTRFLGALVPTVILIGVFAVGLAAYLSTR